MNSLAKSLSSLLIVFLFNCERSDSPIELSNNIHPDISTITKEIISKVDSIQLSTTIQTLQKFETRFAYSPQCYEAAIWIMNKLALCGYSVKDQTFQHYLLSDICFVDELNGWIVGDYGLILHSGDGGNTWNRQETPIYGHFNEVFFIDAFNGWAGGPLVKTSNGGQTWETVEGPTRNALYDIYFLNKDVGWICAYEGVYQTSDGGNTWQETYISEGCQSIYFISESVGFLCQSGFLLKTINAGHSWFKILEHDNRLSDLDFCSSKSGITISDEGEVFITEDGGNTWDVRKVLTGSNFSNCQVLNPEFYVCQSQNSISASRDSGKTWTTYSTNDSYELINAFTIKNSDEIFSIGRSFFYHSSDAGQTWGKFSLEDMEQTALLHNISAIKLGKKYPEMKIVIGAHYDAITNLFDYGNMLAAPGANDNASGSAGIMEIARILSEYDFEFSVEFILFDHEEPVPHLLGSQYASNISYSNKENIVEMINLDMIGYCPDGIYDIQVYSPNVEHISDFISSVSEFSDILVYQDENYLSDDKSYGDLGYTTLGISEHTYPTIRDYPWYHSRDDKLDKLNLSFASEVIKFTLVCICSKAIPLVK